jgi:hypothetical protein
MTPHFLGMIMRYFFINIFLATIIDFRICAFAMTAAAASHPVVPLLSRDWQIFAAEKQEAHHVPQMALFLPGDMLRSPMK